MGFYGSYDFPWRQKWTINNTGLGALSNFPLQVISTYIEPRMAPHVRFVRVSSGGQVQCKHEYVGSTYYAGRWYTEFTVLIPTILAGVSEQSQQELWAYYGNAAVPSAEDAEGVWTDATGFVGVWHLDETSGHFEDSTSGGRDTTTETVSARALTTGASFDGVDDILVVDHDAAFETNDFTLEAYCRLVDLGETHYLFEKGTYEATGKYVYISNLGVLAGRTNQASATQQWTSGSAAVTAGAWHHLAAVKDGSAGLMYVNGTDETAGSPSLTNPAADSGTLQIGKYNTQGSGFFPGEIAESRISSVARSADWIAATSKNLHGTYVVEAAPIYIGHISSLNVVTQGISVRQSLTTKESKIEDLMSRRPTRLSKRELRQFKGRAGKGDGA